MSKSGLRTKTFWGNKASTYHQLFNMWKSDNLLLPRYRRSGQYISHNFSKFIQVLLCQKL